TRRFAASAQMYAEAFARDPALADDPTRSRRYHAACAAALAAAGAGDAGALIDGPARSTLRGRALAWLRAEHDVWIGRFPRATPAEQLEVARNVRKWLTDNDLAGVRDESLATLA